MRLLVVGASASATCGIRDYAVALDPWLGSPETVWWERDPGWSAADTRRAARRFRRELGAALAERPDAVLWSYSAFDYGPRTAWDLHGTPLHAPAIARRLRASSGPLVTVVHEAAYGFRERGFQHNGLAATQRAALVAVVAASDGLVAATGDRERWLRSRRWLPRRPLEAIPICGNLPRVEHPLGTRDEIAVMSFGADDACVATVAGALGTLRARGVDARLRLVGQPGAAGSRAQRWREAAEQGGWAGALSFSGVVERPELSRELSAAPLVLFPNAQGPITAKSTIASALAHGRPVVAIDGPKRWDGFAPAMALAPPDAPALADCLERLLADDAERRRLGEAGAELYERELAPEVTARRLLAFAEEVAA